MISQSVTCEQCGAQRGPSNHWLELRYIRGAPYLLKWSRAAEKPGSKHICGAGCAHLVLDKHLAALQEKPVQTEES